MTTRVVITGLGMVTPLGNDVATTWAGITSGKSGIAPVSKFDPSQHGVKFAGEVRDFDVTQYLDRKEARRNDQFVHFAMAGARQAVADSGLDIASMRDDVGVIIGCGRGGMRTMEEQYRVLFDKGPDRISPFFITMMVEDMASGVVSMQLGARGPNFSTVSACATSAHSIGESFEIIRRGDAKAVICGGTEASVNAMCVAAFDSMRALSRNNENPQGASRPFDAERDGFVLSEGAAILVIEDLEVAKARGAKIYAEIIGYGATADAHHITEPAPGGAGLVRAIRRALKKAGIAPEQVDYINAHGTSTKFNDRDETKAIKTVFGDHAYKVAISSTKSMTGHMVGAAGGIEASISALALREGIIPPTINYHTPDPECDLDYVPNTARKAPLTIALSNSMGFGGHNATLVLKRYED